MKKSNLNRNMLAYYMSIPANVNIKRQRIDSGLREAMMYFHWTDDGDFVSPSSHEVKVWVNTHIDKFYQWMIKELALHGGESWSVVLGSLIHDYERRDEVAEDAKTAIQAYDTVMRAVRTRLGTNDARVLDRALDGMNFVPVRSRSVECFTNWMNIARNPKVTETEAMAIYHDVLNRVCHLYNENCDADLNRAIDTLAALYKKRYC